MDRAEGRREVGSASADAALGRAFAEIAPNAPFVIYQFRVRPDGTYDFPIVSSGFQDLFGIQPGAIAGRRGAALSRVHPDDRKALLDRILEAMSEAEAAQGRQFLQEQARNRTAYVAEGLRRHKAGHFVALKSSGIPRFGPDGAFLGFRGVTRNVTERRQAEQALREREAKYRAAVDSSPDAFMIMDSEGSILEVNDACTRMTGYARDELAAIGLRGFAEESPEETAANLAKIARDGGAVFESSVRKKDGSVIPVEVAASLHPFDGGRLFSFVRDITQRVHLEQQLRQSQKMEAVGQLAGGVAHDFNNLLTVISGNCELLLSDTPADDPRRGSLADIRSASERAASLTRQLLAFSRKQILEPRLVDVHEVVTGIEKMLRRIIGEDVELLTDLAADQSWVKVDPGQLEQVVMNLAVNARDAMPRGGRITIRTRNVDPAASVDLEEAGEPQRRPQVAISISDTGSGIPPEVKAHLFEPFFTTKAAGKGTGLGLATVYGIVKQSGGDVTVESGLGRGTTFTVVLPSQPAPRRTRGASGAHRALPRGTETVLVVEDEDAVRRIVKIALEATGYRVIEARNGTEALEAARTYTGGIHIVVTDVVMPEMSGRELAERIMKNHPGVRILYMSGYTDDSVIRHGIVESGVAFLRKPFSPLALARRVREVLDEAG